jgi:hypothetical protein
MRKYYIKWKGVSQIIMGLLIFHDTKKISLSDMLSHSILRHHARFKMDPKIIYVYLHDVPDPNQIYIFLGIPVYPVLWVSPNHTLSMEVIKDDIASLGNHLYEINQENGSNSSSNVSSRRSSKTENHQQYSFDRLSNDFKVS